MKIIFIATYQMLKLGVATLGCTGAHLNSLTKLYLPCQDLNMLTMLHPHYTIAEQADARATLL